MTDRTRGFLLPNAESLSWHAKKGVQDVLIHAKALGASDIYIKTDRPVIARVHGRLVRLTERALSHPEVQSVTNELYGGDNAQTEISRGKALDNAYMFAVGRGLMQRYRWCATGVVNPRGLGIAIVLRELNEVPSALKDADFPKALLDNLYPDDGLVLVCGETGSGKTTLLAGAVRRKAEEADADMHIVMFEAPPEYLFDKIETVSCEIDQSAVPDHLGSFAAGVVNALRRDPDMIVVGESRDAETIKASVLAAQTGHLVLTTVHANSVGTVFLRLLQTLPPEEAASIMGSIIDSIRVVICQRLYPSPDGRRVAVREWLVFDQRIRLELLRAASSNLTELPEVAMRLLRTYGETKSSHAQRLLDEGRLGREHFDAICMQDTIDFQSVNAHVVQEIRDVAA